MKINSDYSLLVTAMADAEEIVEKLRHLKTEYHPKEVRSLVRQYEWTVISIIRLCNKILDTEPSDCYGKEVDDRIKVEKILYKYEEIFNKIKK